MLGLTVTNTNDIREEIKRRINTAEQAVACAPLTQWALVKTSFLGAVFPHKCQEALAHKAPETHCPS